MKTGQFIPNKKRAIITGQIATIYKGRRIVRFYNSGDPLIGQLPENDAPPFTGFVREFHNGRN